MIVPEIGDYEVRRELLRLRRDRALDRLADLILRTELLTITSADFQLGAELWAVVRQRGRPTASNDALDGDVLLAAQTVNLKLPDTVIATTNVAHMARFTAAALWSDILP